MLPFIWYVLISGCPSFISYDVLPIEIRTICYEIAKHMICYKFQFEWDTISYVANVS